MRRTGAIVAVVLLAACADGRSAMRPETHRDPRIPITVVMGGDVMLGRGVATVWRSDPVAPTEGIRPVILDADLAIANLESPLTDRPHRLGPDALEAPPGAARALVATGFDAMAIANNHAADAGPATVSDTVQALDAVGLPAVGASDDGTPTATIVGSGGIDVALLAFDTDGTPGVTGWDPVTAAAAVRDARRQADLVLASIHGGIPYWGHPGRGFARVARLLARSGADVVWGHGPHVAHPVRIVERDGRTSVLATSLGNLVFDEQGREGTDRGLLLEVRAGIEGPLAFRIGDVVLEAGRSRFGGWREPSGDAVGFDDGWWSPLSPVEPRSVVPVGRGTLDELDPTWAVEQAIRGDVDGDGRPEIVVAFRDPFVRREIHAALDRPRMRLTDEQGRVARLAIYDADLRPRWIGSLVARPIADLAACDGSLAVSYRRLDDPSVTGTGLWRWHLFGFVSYPGLSGAGAPGCADVDRDGTSDPVITGREAS